MKVFATGILFIAMLCGAAPAARAADAAGPLEGTWHFTAATVDGKDNPPDQVNGMEFVATGATYKIQQAGKEIESGTFKTGKEGDVDTVDFSVLAGEDKGKTQPGIFKVDGNSLKLAYFEDAKPTRPKELATKAGQSFISLERGPAPATAPAGSPSPAASPK